MNDDRYKNDKLICYQKQFLRFQWVFFLQVTCLGANFYKQLMVRERAAAEFSLRVKTIYACPSLRPKADVFTQDTHVNDATCFFSNSKNRTITCLWA